MYAYINEYPFLNTALIYSIFEFSLNLGLLIAFQSNSKHSYNCSSAMTLTSLKSDSYLIHYGVGFFFISFLKVLSTFRGVHMCIFFG